MSGITLDQITEAELGSSVIVDPEQIVEVPVAPKESKFGEMANKVLTAETGAGAIGDYLEHPMNFNNSMGLAQLLRGLTGIIGNLDLAIIDVVLGALRFSKERKAVIDNDIYERGNSIT